MLLRAVQQARWGAARAMSTIPVKNVARVVRMKVSGEADAVKADAIVSRVASDLSASQLPGYLKVNRTVCKSEWAYEYEIIFSDLENFKSYMGSDFRTKQMMPHLDAAKKLAVGEVYEGNRVYDEIYGVSVLTGKSP